MPTLITILKQAEEFLQKKGISNARFDAEVLFTKALGCKRIDLYLRYNSKLNEQQLQRIRVLLTRRALHEPLQYIVEEWPFYELILKINKFTLIPRPETEFLVESLIKRYRNKNLSKLKILDLGTGSGAIALSLAKAFPHLHITATDKNYDALSLAKENAQKNRIKNISFIESNWYSNIHEKFDLIISNPPYLTEKEWEEAQIEIKNFEPKSALVANNNGQEDLLKIINEAPKFLKENGTLVLETGNSQHQSLLTQIYAKLFKTIESLKDQFGQDRFLILYL